MEENTTNIMLAPGAGSQSVGWSGLENCSSRINVQVIYVRASWALLSTGPEFSKSFPSQFQSYISPHDMFSACFFSQDMFRACFYVLGF